MRKGQIVTVFEDPLTEKKPEGEAKLIEFSGTTPMGLKEWMVQFLDDKPKEDDSEWPKYARLFRRDK